MACELFPIQAKTDPDSIAADGVSYVVCLVEFSSPSKSKLNQATLLLCSRLNQSLLTFSEASFVVPENAILLNNNQASESDMSST
nr:hypothetical protein Iba_chr06cCG17000 [Ipomoea batatas]